MQENYVIQKQSHLDKFYFISVITKSQDELNVIN